jgi:hypothetical protein
VPLSQDVVSKISKLMLNLPKMIINMLIVMLSVILNPCRYWRRWLMSSVMTMLGLLDGGLSDGMAIKSEWMDRILPRRLVMLTLMGVASNDSDLGRGMCAGEICRIV